MYQNLKKGDDKMSKHQTKPYLFQDYLVLALSSQWIEKFNGIPTFDVKIDKEGRLHLVTNEVMELEFQIRKANNS